jgi:hypothetical protein
MSRDEKSENQIKELSQDELTALREWFAAFDGDAWDLTFETIMTGAIQPRDVEP